MTAFLGSAWRVSFLSALHRLLILALFAFSPGWAWSSPASTNLQPMVNECEVIAVARFVNPTKLDKQKKTVELELTRILKGDLKPGKHTVRYTDTPHVGSHADEFVAFFRPGMQWQFVAQPISKENDLAEGVLQVYGFYDWNAYIVYPGLVTLKHLEMLIKGSSLPYRFKGPVFFPKKGADKWEASTLIIDLLHDPSTKETTVTGLPELKDFPAKPDVMIRSLWHGDTAVSLTYSRSTWRPLILVGSVLGIDRQTRAMESRFWIQEPELLTREAFEAYASNARLGQTYYKCKLTCDPPEGQVGQKSMTLVMGSDGNAGSGRLERWTDSPLKVLHIAFRGPSHSSWMFSRSMPPDLLPVTEKDKWSLTLVFCPNEEEYLMLLFDIGAPSQTGLPRKGRYPHDVLLHYLRSADVTGSVRIYKNGTVANLTRFTASLEGVYQSQVDESLGKLQKSEEDTGNEGWDGEPVCEAYMDCAGSPGFWRRGARVWRNGLVRGAVIGAGILLIGIACIRVTRKWRVVRPATNNADGPAPP